jgi:beta-lactamase class A
MLHCLRAMAILVAILLAVMTYVLTQSQQSSAPVALSPTSAAPATAAPTQPTVSASATPPRSAPGSGDDAPLPQGVHVAGIEVGGMRPSAAQARLATALAPLLHPLDLWVDTARATLRPEDIDMHIPLDVLIAEAQSAPAGAGIALRVCYDAARLRSVLEDLARRTDRQPTVVVISDTVPFSRSFAIAPGQRLDVAMAMRQVDARLQLLTAPPQLALLHQPDMRLRHPLPGQLQAQIAALAREWDGVVGIAVSDLADGRVAAQLNQHTVFSGASVMKVAILLYAYLTHPRFTPEQEHWLDAMIIESDNLAANDLLAASAGGTTPLDAVRGARAMSTLLRDLGLAHTYQYLPYQSDNYPIDLAEFDIMLGPKREGTPPYTNADRVLRSTPAEMSRVFLWIEQCSYGGGILLERFAGSLTAARCQEMLHRLEQNGDHSRMLAGFPAGTRVAHKSGWIADMQADVGIVHSPGGDFLLAVYVYRPSTADVTEDFDAVARPAIAGFARLVYTYYNPTLIDPAMHLEQHHGECPNASSQTRSDVDRAGAPGGAARPYAGRDRIWPPPACA